MPHTDRLSQLLADLDHENTITAEEARAELTSQFGAEALAPLIAAAPRLSRFGRLCAIEIFEVIEDPRAAPVLIPWLKSEDDVVRERSAGALGDLGVTGAVPDLLEAWRASKARDTPPDWSEPATLRRALAQLGARDVVLPAAAAELEVDAPWDHAWPASALPRVFEHLAQARQVVLYFQYWTRHPEYDPYLSPSLADLTIPFVSGYKEPWMSIGIVAGWALVALGVSYYFRARIGVARWKKLHRWTALAWLGGIAHSLGQGTDAGTAWFLVCTAVAVVPALVLLVVRHLPSTPVPSRT